MVARKTSSLPTRIWSFAAKVSREWRDQCSEILSRQHAYKHRLIRIEEARLKEYRDTRKHYVPEITDIERDLRLALDLAPSDERQAQIDAAREALSSALASFEKLCAPARAEFLERKKPFAGSGPATISRVNNEILDQMLSESEWSEAWKDIAMAERSALEEAKRARARCGLSKGCYLSVEEAVKAAIKDSRPMPPQLPAWAGAGRISVQLDKHNTWEDIVEGRNQFLQVTYADDRPLGERGNSAMRIWEVKLRIGSGVEGNSRAPVWFHFKTRLHRIPPKDAVVKWAWLKVFQMAGTPKYRFQIVLEHESFRWMPQPGAVGTLEIECCHEPIRRGVRVARWKGSDGAKGEVVVSKQIMSHFEHTHRLRSILDKVRLEGYRAIRKWLSVASNNKLHGWNRLRKDWKRLKLIAICRQYVKHVGVNAPRDSYLPLGNRNGHWKKSEGTAEQRFALWLDSWIRKERHLWQYWRHSEVNVVNKRNHFFRMEAQALRRRYALLAADTAHLIPNTNMSEEERASRQASAPGECRSIFREAFGLPRSPGSRGTSQAPKKKPKAKKAKTKSQKKKRAKKKKAAA